MAEPTYIRVITPAAAAYLWRKSPVTLHNLDAGFAGVWLKESGRKPCRLFSFKTLCERWGEPDDNRLAMLEIRELPMHITSDGGTVWELVSPRPMVVDQDGNMALELKE